MAIAFQSVSWDRSELTLTSEATNTGDSSVNVEGVIRINGQKVWDEGHHYPVSSAEQWPITLTQDVIPSSPSAISVRFFRHDTGETVLTIEDEFSNEWSYKMGVGDVINASGTNTLVLRPE